MKPRLALAGLLAAACATFAATPAIAATTACTAPTLTQPFLSFGDSNSYALPGGESYDNFDGTGWTLIGGAKLVTTTLADGSTGQVLDLPSGSRAISPAVCVSSNYPSARTMVRQVSGVGTLTFSVFYRKGSGWSAPHTTDWLTGTSSWNLSAELPLNPPKHGSWWLGRYTFAYSGPPGDYQLYNFYIDPYST